MAKFYVRSGLVREVLVAEDAEGAALAALESFFAPLAWVYEDPTLSNATRRDHIVLEALLQLDAELCVSQRGFHDSGCVRLSTADLVDQWHRMTVAMGRLLGEEVAQAEWLPMLAGMTS
jgi:hypothetical protein